MHFDWALARQESVKDIERIGREIERMDNEMKEIDSEIKLIDKTKFDINNIIPLRSVKRV